MAKKKAAKKKAAKKVTPVSAIADFGKAKAEKLKAFAKYRQDQIKAFDKKAK